MKKFLLGMLICLFSVCSLQAETLSREKFNLMQESVRETADELDAVIEKLRAAKEVLRKVQQEVKVAYIEEFAKETPAVKEPPAPTEDELRYDQMWRLAKSRKGNLIIVREIKNLESVVSTAQKDGKIIVKAKDDSPIVGITEVCFQDEKPELIGSWVCNKSSCRLIAPRTRGGTDWIRETKNGFWYRVVENHNLPARSPGCQCVGECACANCKCSSQAAAAAPSSPQYFSVPCTGRNCRRR